MWPRRSAYRLGGWKVSRFAFGLLLAGHVIGRDRAQEVPRSSIPKIAGK